MADEGFKRKLTAVLSADVAGYSRLMGRNEEQTIRTLTSYRTVISNPVQQYRGRVIDIPGDNILAELATQCRVSHESEDAISDWYQPWRSS